MNQWTWSPLSATEFIPSYTQYAVSFPFFKKGEIGKHNMKNIFLNLKPQVLM